MKKLDSLTTSQFFERDISRWGLPALLGRVAGAVAVGSVKIGLILPLGEHLNLIPGFPRTALPLDAVLTLTGMLAVRLMTMRLIK